MGDDDDLSLLLNSVGQVFCRCKRTKCLKLYCECLANGEVCGVKCECHGCENKNFNDKRVIAKMEKTRMQSIVTVDNGELFHKTGCFCKRSKCLKKYCVCFLNLVQCSSKCHCIDCKNVKIDEWISPVPILDFVSNKETVMQKTKIVAESETGLERESETGLERVSETGFETESETGSDRESETGSKLLPDSSMRSRICEKHEVLPFPKRKKMMS